MDGVCAIQAKEGEKFDRATRIRGYLSRSNHPKIYNAMQSIRAYRAVEYRRVPALFAFLTKVFVVRTMSRHCKYVEIAALYLLPSCSYDVIGRQNPCNTETPQECKVIINIVSFEGIGKVY